MPIPDLRRIDDRPGRDSRRTHAGRVLSCMQVVGRPRPQVAAHLVARGVVSRSIVEARWRSTTRFQMRCARPMGTRRLPASA